MAPSVSSKILVTVLGNGIAPLVAFITAPLLAQGLGVIGRGEVGAATAPLTLMLGMLTLGMPEAITHYVAGRTGRLSAILTRGLLFLLVGGLVGTIIVALAADILASGDDELARLITIASLALVPALLLSGLRGLAAGLGSWNLVAAERLISPTSRLIVIVALWASSALTVETATYAIAATSLTGCLAYIPLIARLRRVGTSNRSVDPPPMLSFGARLWIGSLSGILLARLDQALLLPLASAYALGLYVVAVSISELPLIVNSAVREVMFAEESGASDDGRLAIATRLSTFFTAVAAGLVAILAIWLLPLLFGEDFAPALPVLWLLLVAVVLGNPGSVAGAGLSARGRPGLRSVSLLLALVLNVIALILLAPVLGAMGAALATLLGNVVAGYSNLFLLRRVFGLPVRQFVGVRRSDFALIAYQVKSMREKIR